MDEYDDLDSPCASYTDRKFDSPLTADDYLEIIKIGSVVKQNLIKETRKDTATYLLIALRSIVHEQQEIGLLDKNEGSYILDATVNAAVM